MGPPDHATSVAALEGKRANLVSETPSGEILDGGIFKAVITGDSVTGERKQKDPFDFAPRAGHIVSTNWPITTADYSAGFWRRPIMLPFSWRFDQSSERRLAPEAEVLAHELAGVVAWTIEGAARAQRQGGYTMPDQSLALAREWRDGSDQIRLFLSTQTDPSVLQAGAFYDQYREWAKTNGHKNVVTSHTFGRRVMASGLYERHESNRGRFYQRKAEAPPVLAS